MMADGGAVSGLGWCWRGRLKTENLRACFEARTLSVNLEICAGYGRDWKFHAGYGLLGVVKQYFDAATV